MLSGAKIHPTLPAVDLDRARKFYEGNLGLKVLREDPGPGILFGGETGQNLYVHQRGATKADHTVVAFEVADVEAEVRELKAKGVVFEVVDMPGVNTVNGITSMGPIKGAWFKDTEGNILGVTSHAS